MRKPWGKIPSHNGSLLNYKLEDLVALELLIGSGPMRLSAIGAALRRRGLACRDSAIGNVLKRGARFSRLAEGLYELR